jgi:hypothetical protein
MTDEELKDVVQLHDKSIGLMTQSLEHLASEVGTSNRKLEDIISVIGRQNVLMEKFSNLEANLKESFSRLHGNADKLAQDKASNSDLEVVRRMVESLQDSQKWVVRVIIGALLSGTITTLFILIRAVNTI